MPCDWQFIPFHRNVIEVVAQVEGGDGEIHSLLAGLGTGQFKFRCRGATVELTIHVGYHLISCERLGAVDRNPVGSVGGVIQARLGHRSHNGQIVGHRIVAEFAIEHLGQRVSTGIQSHLFGVAQLACSAVGVVGLHTEGVSGTGSQFHHGIFLIGDSGHSEAVGRVGATALGRQAARSGVHLATHIAQIHLNVVEIESFTLGGSLKRNRLIGCRRTVQHQHVGPCVAGKRLRERVVVARAKNHRTFIASIILTNELNFYLAI